MYYNTHTNTREHTHTAFASFNLGAQLSYFFQSLQCPISVNGLFLMFILDIGQSSQCLVLGDAKNK